MTQITNVGLAGTNVAQTRPVSVIPAGTTTGAGAFFSSIASYDTAKNNFTASVTSAGTIGGGATAALYLSHDGVNFWTAIAAVAIPPTGGTINLSASLQVATYAAVGISGSWTGGGTIQATIAAAL